MFQLILYQPEIPPNTGNIIRLCANTGTTLNLIGPLGFELDDKKLRRAGLDYHEWADVLEHASLEACIAALPDARILGFSTRGEKLYSDFAYRPGDAFLFGPETRGLPAGVLDQLTPSRVLRIPMQPASRSLNLSNSAAIVVYEAWRQQGFSGGD
jgi:tRNA (cytidine/uridine-2'-O-)-methyltransferase